MRAIVFAAAMVAAWPAMACVKNCGSYSAGDMLEEFSRQNDAERRLKKIEEDIADLESARERRRFRDLIEMIR
jgi:hypothetical protein